MDSMMVALIGVALGALGIYLSGFVLTYLDERQNKKKASPKTSK